MSGFLLCLKKHLEFTKLAHIMETKGNKDWNVKTCWISMLYHLWSNFFVSINHFWWKWLWIDKWLWQCPFGLITNLLLANVPLVISKFNMLCVVKIILSLVCFIEYYEFLSEVCLASRCIYLWPRGNSEDLSSWYPQVVTIIYFEYIIKYYSILECNS